MHDRWKPLDAAITSSLTTGDMRMYVPVSLFPGVANSEFVYLYSQFGGLNNNTRAGGGYEQWSISAVPAPSALAMMAIAGLTAGGRRRRAC